MAKDYDNTDSGALFKNKEKETDKHPDYQGSINVGGTDYWLSAWLKESKKGEKYMSLAIKAKDGGKASPKTKPQEIDSDVPF
jgi:uncharacterized protein (DUF736 family)